MKCLVWLLLLAQTNLIEQADEAFRSGDLTSAARLAQRALAGNIGGSSGSVHAHLILGIIAAQGQDWPKARQHFAAVIRLAPSDANGHFYLGQAELYQKNWQPAVREFTRALELGYPDQERAVTELAFALNESGRPQEALSQLQQVTAPASGPSAAQYHGVTAFAQGKLHHISEALTEIRIACDLDPGNARYRDFLISTLISTDQTTAALRESIRAQADFPDDPDIQFLFALASYYVAESPLSSLALRNLRECEPDSPRVLLAEGLLLRKQGKTQEATRAFEQAAARGLTDSHLLLGIVYKENGNFDAAATEYEKARRANPDNGQLLLELGKLALARGNAADALPYFQRSAELMPNAVSVHHQLGLLYRRLNNPEKAQYHLNLSRELDRQQAELQRTTQ